MNMKEFRDMEKITLQDDQLKILFSKTEVQKPSDDFADKVMQMVEAHAEAQHADDRLFNIWYWITGLIVLAISAGLLYYFNINLIKFTGFNFDIKPEQIIVFFSKIYKGISSLSEIIQSKHLGVLIAASLIILGGLEFLLQRKVKIRTFLFC